MAESKPAQAPAAPAADHVAEKTSSSGPEAELAAARRRGPVPLNQATHDAIGRELPDDPAERREQAQEAVKIRQARILEDTERTHYGLAPRWATE